MDKNHLLLGQLCKLLNKESYYEHHLQRFLKRSGYDLNYQIPLDCLFAKCKPQCLGYSILHFAVICKRADLIQTLLSNGADFTIKAANGFTPLRLHVENQKDVVRDRLSTQIDHTPELDALLLAHIQYNNPTNPSCNDGLSHFHIACLANNEPIARFFLEAGVSINESVFESSELFPGFSPLHFAVRYGSENLVKLLLTYGPDLNLLDGNGMTPLCLLIGQIIEMNDCILLGKSSYDKNEIEQEFLRNDTLVHLFINKYNDQILVDSSIGLTSFHVSCTMKDITLSERLLKSGADVSCKVNDGSPMWAGYTPAHFAAQCNPKILKTLMENGADILTEDAKGITPFDLFVERYKLTDVSDVLKLHPKLESIQFDNGIKLVDAISAMEQSLDQSSDFYSLVRRVGVNSRVPENSLLWSDFTITHLAVSISKVYYQFYLDYFIKKNHFTSNDYEYCNDNSESVSTCLCFEENITIPVQTIEMMTPLHFAFYLQKMDIVDQILEKMRTSNVLENCVDQSGLSHLQIACVADNAELVGKFLESGSDPNSPLQTDLELDSRLWNNSQLFKTGFTLYHIAAAIDSMSMVEVISKHGLAKMDLLNVDGLTPVHVGFLCSVPYDQSTLEKLLSFSKTNHTSERAGGLSHLHIASYAGDLASIEKLVSDATDIDAAICCKTVIDPYTDKLTPYDGWTPLHFAAFKLFDKAIDLLISAGADVGRRTTSGLNALHLVLQQVFEDKTNFMSGMYSDKIDLIKKLYKELKVTGEWPDHFGLTRLHVACVLRDEDEVKNLLEAGEDVNRQIDANSPIRPGDTALHIVPIGSSGQIIKLLMKNGADITLKNIENLTPLHQLWKYQYLLMYQGYIFKGETMSFISNFIKLAGPQFYRVNPSDNDGLSHFHISCMIGDMDIVKNFLNFGVDINESVCPFDSRYAGFTPIHFAAHHGNEKVVKLLLQRGANWKLENSAGFTPIQEAVLHKSAAVSVLFSKTQKNEQATDIFGDTALKVLIMKRYKQYHELLLNNGVRVNFVDFPANRKEIATAAWKLKNTVFRTLVKRATDVTNVDSSGKNVVHSIGSLCCDENQREVVHCALNVNLWLDRGCDLNLRDKQGQTPLHDAACTGGSAVQVLLLLGADVNIRDNQDHTALWYLTNIDNDNDSNISDDGDYDYSMRELVLKHCLRMSCSGLYLDDTVDEIIRSEYSDEEIIKSQLEKMEHVMIVEGLSLRDLFTEKVVRNFRHFHPSKREVILEFLRPERLLANHNKRESWNSVLQYQYRQILQRTKLLVPARTSFYKSICQLPLECIEIILDDLSNYDLERLIKV